MLTYAPKLRKLIILLGSLMLLDYLLTYIGIYHFKVITEGNPFMHFFMELPFFLGFPLRLFHILLPIGLMIIAFNLAENKKKIITLLYGMVMIQFIPLILHIFWIIEYFIPTQW